MDDYLTDSERPSYYAIGFLDAIAEVYAEANQTTKEEFRVKVFKPQFDNPSLDASALEERLQKEFFEHKHSHDSVAIWMSSAYCAHALIADSDGRTSLAWTYVVSARFWHGVLVGTQYGRGEITKISQVVAIAKGRRGAKKSLLSKAQKYGYESWTLLQEDVIAKLEDLDQSSFYGGRGKRAGDKRKKVAELTGVPLRTVSEIDRKLRPSSG